MKSKKITESNIDDSIFNANSGEWWVEDGAFKALHSFNLISSLSFDLYIKTLRCLPLDPYSIFPVDSMISHN